MSGPHVEKRSAVSFGRIRAGLENDLHGKWPAQSSLVDQGYLQSLPLPKQGTKPSTVNLHQSAVLVNRYTLLLVDLLD